MTFDGYDFMLRLGNSGALEVIETPMFTVA